MGKKRTNARFVRFNHFFIKGAARPSTAAAPPSLNFGSSCADNPLKVSLKQPSQRLFQRISPFSSVFVSKSTSAETVSEDFSFPVSFLAKSPCKCPCKWCLQGHLQGFCFFDHTRPCKRPCKTFLEGHFQGLLSWCAAAAGSRTQTYRKRKQKSRLI